MKELRLIRRALKGNQSSLSALLKIHENQLYKIIYLYTFDEETTITILHEAATKCQQSIHTLRSEELFFQWLLRIHISVALKASKPKSGIWNQFQATYRTTAILLYGVRLNSELVANLLHTSQETIIDIATQIAIDLDGNIDVLYKQYNEIKLPAILTNLSTKSPKTILTLFLF